VIPEQDGIFSQEIMNSYNPGSLPQHDLSVKIGCPLMLLRNVNLFEGLANGTRLKLLDVSESGKVIKVEVMTGPKAQKDSKGKYIFSLQERVFPLFKIPCSNESDKYIKMTRRQFPVRLTYCMSINKAQGQTLKKCGLYLPAPVFSHGQLYVAMSRVSSPENISVFIDTENKTHGQYKSKWYTKNVVYTQLLEKETDRFKKSPEYQGDLPVFSNEPESDSEESDPYRNFQDEHFEQDCPFEDDDFRDFEFSENEFIEEDFDMWNDENDPDMEEFDGHEFEAFDYDEQHIELDADEFHDEVFDLDYGNMIDHEQENEEDFDHDEAFDLDYGNMIDHEQENEEKQDPKFDDFEHFNEEEF